MPIKPLEDQKARPRTCFNILPTGVVEQTTVSFGDSKDPKYKKLKVILRQAMSYEEAKKGESEDYGKIKETNFVFDF
jgi:hypothetical protein